MQTRHWHPRFLRYFASSDAPTVTSAARRAGVSLAQVRWALDHDEQFREGFEIAKQTIRDRVVEAAWKMGVTGELDPVYWQGTIVGHKLVRDSSMTQFLMRGLDPGMWDPKIRAANAGVIDTGDEDRRRLQQIAEFNERFAQLDESRRRLGAATDAVVIDASTDTDDD